MRNSIKSGLLCLIVTMFVLSANAQDTRTFYVCSGTSFTMVPNDSSFTDYEWAEIGGSSNPIATTQNATVTAPSIAGTSYQTVQYTLIVKDGAGCWSTVDTFTVHVLPAPQVTISGNSGPYCAGNSVSDTLTATVGTLTLPTGVSADQYAWTAGGSSVGTNSSTLIFTSGTSAGSTVYAVSVSYSLPGGIGGSKLTSCVALDNTTVVVNAAPTTPAISIQ